MKLLKSVRLDDSDERIFAAEGGAAGDGEWMVSGGYAAADDEMRYTADLAAGFPDDVWITVRREVTADGLGERYSVYNRLMIGAHKLHSPLSS
jgi:hypothetical protein